MVDVPNPAGSSLSPSTDQNNPQGPPLSAADDPASGPEGDGAVIWLRHGTVQPEHIGVLSLSTSEQPQKSSSWEDFLDRLRQRMQQGLDTKPEDEVHQVLYEFAERKLRQLDAELERSLSDNHTVDPRPGASDNDHRYLDDPHTMAAMDTVDSIVNQPSSVVIKDRSSRLHMFNFAPKVESVDGSSGSMRGDGQVEELTPLQGQAATSAPRTSRASIVGPSTVEQEIALYALSTLRVHRNPDGSLPSWSEVIARTRPESELSVG